MNFLEELAAEWFEYNGYFVRRNLKFGGPAGKSTGGHAGEVDVAAFDPKTSTLVHIETSADSDTQATRKLRFIKKFATAAKHYENLFHFPISRFRLMAIVGYSKKQSKLDWRLADNTPIEIKDIPSFVMEINESIGNIDPLKKAVPESLPLLRAIQHAAFYIGRKSMK